MKKLMLMGALSLVVMSTNAQDFKMPLQNTWVSFDTLKMEDPAKVAIANKLSLIAKKWKDEWCTHYYASLGKVHLSYTEKDGPKHDALLDEAEKEHDEAVSILGKENSETFVLAAMIANSRMAVDPMNRWQKYGKIFSDDLESAKELNAENPRIYYMKAVSTFFTPEAFGGGKKAALPYFEKADGFFAKEKGRDISKPYWGKEHNDYFMAQCKKTDKDK